MVTETQKQLASDNVVRYFVRMILEYENYRSYLKAIFITRSKKNSRFSLRAFAQNLGISHSTLSQIFNGNRNLSRETTVQIAEKLKLNSLETEYFCLLVELESAVKLETKNMLLNRINRLRPEGASEANLLSVDSFKMISDWYHYAILQILKIKFIPHTALFISKALGIHKTETEMALERLLRLEMIEETKKNQYQTHQINFRVKSDEKNLALKKFHTQYLEKAIVAFDEQEPKERFTGSETLALSPQSLEKIRKLADEFLKSIADIAKHENHPEEVYHCQINLFRITDIKGVKNEK